MKSSLLLSLLLVTVPVWAGVHSHSEVERAKKLQDYIEREKPDYEKRELARQDVSEALDRLNADQNRVRERMSDLSQNQQELAMAMDNLSTEFKKQKELEQLERKRVYLMLKIVYKLKKDGILHFVVRGSDLSTIAARVRVLYGTLRAHSTLTHHLQERAQRLADSEGKLGKTKEQAARLLVELQEQGDLLDELLSQKQTLLKQISRKQNSYQTALKEYKVVSKQLATLFDNMEPPRGIPSMPERASLPTPLETGKLIKEFGKSIHAKFQTVTFQKGLEIEAPENTPVKAVMDGTVEYDGWVKGLGNVLIIHHGGGLYSVNAHLFKSLMPRGSTVKQGDTVALVGDTGISEKPSLYFELRENGKAVNPLAYFNPKSLAALR